MPAFANRSSPGARLRQEAAGPLPGDELLPSCRRRRRRGRSISTRPPPTSGRGSLRWARPRAEGPTPTTGSRTCSGSTCTASIASCRVSASSGRRHDRAWLEPDGARAGRAATCPRLAIRRRELGLDLRAGGPRRKTRLISRNRFRLPSLVGADRDAADGTRLPRDGAAACCARSSAWPRGSPPKPTIGLAPVGPGMCVSKRCAFHANALAKSAPDSDCCFARGAIAVVGSAFAFHAKQQSDQLLARGGAAAG